MNTLLLDIGIHNDMNINIHNIDIIMHIDITPPTPCSPTALSADGPGMGWGVG